MRPSPAVTPMQNTPRRARRGFASVLAMLFLVLFTTLALGFFGQVTTSVQVADNEKNIADAMFAAESGLQFMRYQMSAVKISAGAASSAVFAQVAAQLKARLDNTSNLGGGTLTAGAATMGIPSAAGTYITLDSATGAGFRADLSDSSGDVVLTVSGRGRSATLTRQIKMTFGRQNSPADVFNYAIAAQGQIDITKDTVTGITDNAIATLMSTDASPAIQMSGGLVGGTLNVTVSKSYAQITGGSVNGDTNLATIRVNDVNVVKAPEFPKIDTTQFAQYAVNQYSAWKTGSPYNNIYVKKTDSAKFNGNDVINGILYIESGADVEFRGNATINGIVVVAASGTVGGPTVDTLSFSGDVTQGAVPAGAAYSALRPITGYSIVAPTTAVTMTGNNHSTLSGSMIVGTIAFAGSADLTVNGGTLLSYSIVTDADVLGGKTIQFGSTGSSNLPTYALSFSQVLTPTVATYEEPAP